MNVYNGGRNIRLVILEDQAPDAELILEEVREFGMELESYLVQTREDFLARLELEPDVILADYFLPQFGALAALAELRELGLDIPLIVVSGSIGDEKAAEIIKQGAVDYLLKDRLARLGPAILQAIDSRREQAARRRAEACMRESENTFRQLAENIGHVFWLANSAGTEIFYVSPAYEKVWGRTAASLYADPSSRLDAMLPPDPESPPRGDAINGQYRIVRPDGAIRWIHERIFPVRNDAGKVHRLAGIAEDITEQRDLEERLRQSQKMEAIGQLTGGVAHDFNNILTVIQGYSQCLLNAESLTAEARQEIGEVLLAAERAAGLTRQLLSFGRRQTMQLRTLDLNEVVASVARLLQRTIGADVSLRLECTTAPVLVNADGGMMEQVLMNLAVNARDAMPGGGTLFIRTGTRLVSEGNASHHPRERPGLFACLNVEDTGQGMLPEVVTRIFEPFFTTKRPGKGTGLGLATVDGIVQQHGGWIEVDSKLRVGTSFRILLPVTATPVRSEVKEANPAPVRGGAETILLVEDEACVREIAAIILRRLGYRVLEAGSGLAALGVWHQHGSAIDLLVTDLIMPDGLGGHELIMQLQQAKPGLKAILTSGYFVESAGENFVLTEGFNFLQKPYRPQNLAKIVRDRLDVD